MTRPATLGKEIPTIVLGGESWPVPPLTLGANRILQPLFGRVADRILGGQVTVAQVTEQDMDDLIEIAFVAVQRAHPTMSRDEFNELPIGVLELVGALLPTMQQSGLFRPQASAGAGEAPGAASPQTGTGIVARLSRRLGMPWDVVENTITVARWEAYEDEWRDHPTVDDLAAWWLKYEPPAKPGEAAKNPETMNPADFARFVKATGGSKLSPGA